MLCSTLPGFSTISLFFPFPDEYSLIGSYLSARKTNLWLYLTDHEQMNRAQKEKWIVSLGADRLLNLFQRTGIKLEERKTFFSLDNWYTQQDLELSIGFRNQDPAFCLLQAAQWEKNSIPYLNLISGRQEKGRRAVVLNSHSMKRTLSLNLLHVVPSVCTAKSFLKSIYRCGGLFHASQTNSGVTATH